MSVSQVCWVAASPTTRSPDQIDELASRLPAWRREACDRRRHPGDREACVVAFSLLQDLWHTHHESPLPRIIESPTGQLLVDTPGWHLSLTHRDGWAACALAPAPVGLDLTGPIHHPGLIEHIASPAERAQVDDGDDAAWLWTRKEALAKRTGEGIGRDVAHLDTSHPDLRTWVHSEPPLTMSVACAVDVQVPDGWQEVR